MGMKLKFEVVGNLEVGRSLGVEQSWAIARKLGLTKVATKKGVS